MQDLDGVDDEVGFRDADYGVGVFLERSYESAFEFSGNGSIDRQSPVSGEVDENTACFIETGEKAGCGVEVFYAADVG